MLNKLIAVKYYILSFALGCLVCTLSFLLFPSKESLHIVKTEEHTQIKQEVQKEIVSNKAVEMHETKGRIVTQQKTTRTQRDGSVTVSEKSTVEEPVVKDTKEVSQVESKEMDKISVDKTVKSEETVSSVSKLSRYSLGYSVPPLEIVKGDFRQSRIELGLRAGNLPIWGVMSSTPDFKLSVGLRLEF